MRRGDFQREAARGGAVLLAAIALGGCVRERAPARSVVVAPVAEGATEARSQNSATKVALRPIGLVPYDGLELPVITPDGKFLATKTPDGAMRVFDLSRSPLTGVDVPQAARLTLSGSASAHGFYVGENDGKSERTFRLLNASTLEMAPAEAPRLREAVESRLSGSCDGLMMRHARRSVVEYAWNGSRYTLFYDPRRAALALLEGDQDTSIRVPGDAGCLSSDASGLIILLSRPDGLYMQRLTRGTVWEASDPVRLLREPYVPRATSDPAIPFVLIGPGPRGKEEMLSILALSLIAE